MDHVVLSISNRARLTGHSCTSQPSNTALLSSTIDVMEVLHMYRSPREIYESGPLDGYLV
jgi:hypothetical protein